MRVDRLRSIEQYVLQQSSVSLEDLAEHFDVSTNTIRRDINELLEGGRIQKVYGGVAARSDFKLLPMSIRATTNTDDKLMIGMLAASLVKDGDTIFLDSGSTTPCMIPHLSSREGVTIVTHSLPAMYEASKYPNLKIISLGGLYNVSTSSFVGNSSLEAMSRLSVQAAFMAATGVSIQKGLTNTTYFEADIKQHIVQRANRVILMADQTKFDNDSTITFFDFPDLYAVVTNAKPRDEYMDVIKKNSIKLLYPRD
ncbi:MAG: DeoR/GlpR family DNA-binding transcription regulator [Lachnospiraceae bacterium]|jgi:DeoR family myo-inositol catabolism operon transcriptional repressor|nr:DeoR/GlpR family DNA-binding transcription regulator [Lachnospiraceae bacterium]